MPDHEDPPNLRQLLRCKLVVINGIMALEQRTAWTGTASNHQSLYLTLLQAQAITNVVLYRGLDVECHVVLGNAGLHCLCVMFSELAKQHLYK